MNTRRTDGLRALGAYLLVFAILAAPWLGVAGDAIPRAHGTPFVYADDARLIIWVLGWVAHAAVAAPGALLDAPILRDECVAGREFQDPVEHRLWPAHIADGEAGDDAELACPQRPGDHAAVVSGFAEQCLSPSSISASRPSS